MNEVTTLPDGGFVSFAEWDLRASPQEAWQAWLNHARASEVSLAREDDFVVHGDDHDFSASQLVVTVAMPTDPYGDFPGEDAPRVYRAAPLSAIVVEMMDDNTPDVRALIRLAEDIESLAAVVRQRIASLGETTNP